MSDFGVQQHLAYCRTARPGFFALLIFPDVSFLIGAAIKENNLTAELLHPAKGSVLHMIQLAKDTPPFSRADAAYYSGCVEHIFSEEGIQNTLAYV